MYAIRSYYGSYFLACECLKIINNNESLLIKLVNSFVTKQKHTAEYLKIHLLSGNFGNASSIIHDIIGLSGNLCCKLLHDISVKLQSEIKKGEFSSLESFIEIWNETMLELNKFLENKNESPEKIVFEMDNDKVLDTFKMLCKEYDISAADYFIKNKSSYNFV